MYIHWLHLVVLLLLVDSVSIWCHFPLDLRTYFSISYGTDSLMMKYLFLSIKNCLLIFISEEEHLRTQNSDWQLFLFLIYHIPYIIKNFNFTFQQFDYAVPKMWFSFFVFITLGVHCISWIYKLMSLGKFSAIISSVFLLP